MKVIIAGINQPAEKNEISAALLAEECKLQGIAPPEYVYSGEQLLRVLEKYMDENLILFSNFPHDSRYPGNNKKSSQNDVNEIPERSRETDGYAKSIAFFTGLAAMKGLKAMHFITGAPAEVVSDKLLQAFAPQIEVSVKRRQEWLFKKVPYETLQNQYMIEKIKQAKEGLEKYTAIK